MSEYLAAIERDGYAILPDVLPRDVVESLTGAVEPLLTGLTRVRGGIRDVLRRCPEVRAFAGSSLLRRWIEPVLGPDCVAVNALLFDKANGRNWKVPYHQDLTIRVRERREVPGFETWWEKDGIPHAWPPAEVVERMLAVRVHLDECGPENGPLRVIPGTHRSGVLASDAIATARDRGPEVVCQIGRGGLVVMRPLLLHASSTAERPARRRVLHIEYAVPDLPDGLAWHDAVRAGSGAPAPS